ncbi:hypothetical protein OBCHQ24_15490 [Oceanobacillus iheyensis]|nr:hypothetical protein OBCHQ24_15490 [Oceanobacillus iheyensis]
MSRKINPQKGFDVLLKAFKQVNTTLSNTHLTIMGEGKQREELEFLAKDLNLEQNVSLVGYKENPYPYYYYSDLYILSSRYEGFPNTLLEALACGTKVIATNCKSGPIEIIEDNNYGVLVPVDDEKVLAKSIIEYLKLENRTGNRANFFDINKIINEYESLLL